MFDVDKIINYMREKHDIYIYIPTREIYKEFCESFFLEFCNKDVNLYSMADWLGVYDRYYNIGRIHEGECVIGLTWPSSWGHCYREYYNGKTIIDYTEFIYKTIEIDKDNLLDFLKG